MKRLALSALLVGIGPLYAMSALETQLGMDPLEILELSLISMNRNSLVTTYRAILRNGHIIIATKDSFGKITVERTIPAAIALGRKDQTFPANSSWYQDLKNIYDDEHPEA